jgi:hypothetical protein
MNVVAFARPEPPSRVLAEVDRVPTDKAENRLRWHGRAMRLCLLALLAAWLALQSLCLLSLFLRFRSGIVAGTIDGTLAFRFWPLVEYFSPDHAQRAAFVPRIFPFGVCAGYTLILALAALPFCAALLYLAELFGLYAAGEILTRRTTRAMRRAGQCLIATGVSPLLLGPAAHALRILRPLSGISAGMIVFFLVGLMLVAFSNTVEIGDRLRREQEEIV